MYIGGYELDTVEVMRGILKKGDTFIDVGANIGYLSGIGAGLVGKKGKIHSFEPVPQYFDRLKNLAKMNPDYKIITEQCALGDKPGYATIRMSNEQNIGWNTMVFLSEKKDKIKQEFKVPVHRLDNYIKEKALNKIALIKIDVEGFEFSVLKGLSEYFEHTDTYPAIICEINPFACSILGYTLTQLTEYMKSYNYNAYSLVNSKIKVDITKIRELADVVFLPSVSKRK